MIRNLSIILAAVVVLVSCSRSYKEEDLTMEALSKEDSLKIRTEQTDEKLMETNKVLLQKERDRILSYAQRRAWTLQEVKGSFVQIIKQGDGQSLQQGDKLSLSYTCQMLTGDTLYTSAKDGELYMQIGKAAECPLGLQLVVETLSYNTEARVIVPYNLAYGLSGDGKRIPKSASLIYTLKVNKSK